MASKLTVLIALTDSLGHFSTLKAVADELLHRKHRVIFFSVSNLDTEGYEAITASDLDNLVTGKWTANRQFYKNRESNSDISAEKKWTDIVQIVTPVFRLGVKELAKESIRLGHEQCQNEVSDYHDKLEKFIKLLQPSIIVSDLMVCYPCIMNQFDIKWVRFFLGASLAIYGRHYPTLLPPEWYGLPTLCDADTIAEYRHENYKMKMTYFKELNQVLKRFNKPMPEDSPTVEFVPESPYINIYMYPRAIDYDEVIRDVKRPDNWFHVNSLVPSDLSIRHSKTLGDDHRRQIDHFIKRKEPKQKLIYFSLGTLASADIELMKRLIGFLAKDTKNLYIISMGPMHQQLKLSSNMFGRKFIDQLYVLPKIDLIITHGGNNTITESFHYGVPGLVVLPVFDDQHDNARRVEEIKVGRRLQTYKCSGDDLLQAIQSVLDDASIKKRMKKFSQAAEEAKGLETACNMIEELARN